MLSLRAEPASGTFPQLERIPGDERVNERKRQHEHDRERPKRTARRFRELERAADWGYDQPDRGGEDAREVRGDEPDRGGNQ